ncbi:MAG: protein adenylyltransferase SelO [bacterium]
MPHRYRFAELPFDNRFAQLPDAFYRRVAPRLLEGALTLIDFNEQAADLIQLDPHEAQQSDFLTTMAGGSYPKGCDPLAMLYAGHQFGHYVSQLGDGRAIMLGDTQGWELQLKGSGETPFSRAGDGRAVLRSTIREYLCSEAMHGLGIPTTRALCLVGSEEEVCREQIETGAMLLRMSPSHIRFGSFEIFFYRQQFDRLQELADFVLQHYYPEHQHKPEPYLALLADVTERTAQLIAQWQCVGFAHGVMNTDNMSILGLTLDYGPFGFLDQYDPKFICNHSDHYGRYAFDQQPSIGLWNISCLAQALLPLLAEEPDDAVAKAQEVLAAYQPTYQQAWLAGMRKKLGLHTENINDTVLINDLLAMLTPNQVDYTLFFRHLSHLDFTEKASIDAVRDLFLHRTSWDQWASRYQQRLQQETQTTSQRHQAMLQTNPKFILRNYLAQLAIEQAQQGNYSEITRLRRLLQRPFEEHQPEDEHYAGHPPTWASEISVSCSS